MKKHFTLTELVIVIAIIALLATLPAPLFSAAKDRAKVTQCMGNLKSIGVAIAKYAEDNNGFGPSLAVKATWKKSLVKGGYLPSAGSGKMGVFQCPDAPVLPRYNRNGEDSNWGYGMWRYYSDWNNNWKFTAQAEVYSAKGLKATPTKNNRLSGVKLTPAEVTYIMDSYNVKTKTTWYYINRYANGSVGGNEKIHLLHENRANSLMGDGHVKSMTEAEFKAIGWVDTVFQRN